jgi:hypothetical protein
MPQNTDQNALEPAWQGLLSTFFIQSLKNVKNSEFQAAKITFVQ